MPLNNNGSILIRFTHNGYRYSLGGLGKFDDSTDFAKAKLICDKIAIDIRTENFRATSNTEVVNLYHFKHSPSQPQKSLCIVEILKVRLSEKFHNADKSLLSLLEQYDKAIESIQDAQKFIQWLQNRSLAASTLQRYLNTLRAISPHFRAIQVKAEPKKPVKPFTQLEVRLICEWFQENHPNYSDFIKCLFITGMRTSEAIGLQWKDIDFQTKTLTISESLTSPKRSAQRIRKSTKTGIPRHFPMNAKLLALFESRYRTGMNSQELVFQSPQGKPINDHNFSQRIWKRCLAELQIEHRSFYSTRHTFISHFLEQTKDFVKCASLTHGTRSGVQTILNHYAGIIDRIEVPEMF